MGAARQLQVCCHRVLSDLGLFQMTDVPSHFGLTRRRMADAVARGEARAG